MCRNTPGPPISCKWNRKRMQGKLVDIYHTMVLTFAGGTCTDGDVRGVSFLLVRHCPVPYRKRMRNFWLSTQSVWSPARILPFLMPRRCNPRQEEARRIIKSGLLDRGPVYWLERRSRYRCAVVLPPRSSSLGLAHTRTPSLCS
jgi:hypothetical protein